jgi:Zn-dependent protease
MGTTMKIKEIATKAGSISDYLGYIILLFGWYLINDITSAPNSGLFGSPIDPILPWVLSLLVGPIVFAIVFGGIHEQQEAQDLFERKSFFSNIKTHFLRLAGANLLSFVFYYVATIIILLIAGYQTLDSDSNKVVFGIISIFYSTISLFWYSAVVVERKIFRGLAHSFKTLLFNPVTLVTAVIWGGFCFADTFFFDFQSEPIPLGINLARAGVFAVLRVLATMFILVVHKNFWGSFSEDTLGVGIPGKTAAARPGEKLARTSLGFTFVSFVPLLHLVALILGVLALKRGGRFILRAAVACCVGGFFTILYVLVLAGLLVSGPKDYRLPDYTFLSVGNAEVEPYVTLLDQEAYEDVQWQIEDSSTDNSSRPWEFDGALALAKYQNNDVDGSLKDFYAALQKNPERSEFYFYYGMALLESENNDMALEQFRLALEHEPKLKIAENYRALVQNAYQPSQVISAIMYILILLILFTIHEFGHAFAAWKLGDDTAKNQGRLTLNPIAHLDLFGSIILPAILLIQQSDFMFGWARPVPVDPRNFKNPKKDHMLVAFAGPAANLLISMLCMLILALIMIFIRVLWPGSISLNLADPYATVSLAGPPLAKWILLLIVFIRQLFYTSLILGFFNLLPVPPLDGSWILAGLLPDSLGVFFDKVRPFSFILFFLLIMTPVVDYFLSVPIGVAYLGLDLLVSALGFA